MANIVVLIILKKLQKELHLNNFQAVGYCIFWFSQVKHNEKRWRKLQRNRLFSISRREIKSMKFMNFVEQDFYDKIDGAVKHGLDVSKYSKLIAFWKRKNESCSHKKSRTLTSEQVDRFIIPSWYKYFWEIAFFSGWGFEPTGINRMNRCFRRSSTSLMT